MLFTMAQTYAFQKKRKKEHVNDKSTMENCSSAKKGITFLLESRGGKVLTRWENRWVHTEDGLQNLKEL